MMMAPPEMAICQKGEMFTTGRAPIGLIPQNDKADASEKAHGADGNNDRRQSQTRHQHPVERAAEQADG